MSNDPLVGQKLGDYSILGLLGQGGMARVYRGYDETLDRYAAVKVIEPNLVASEDEQEYRERFLREARSIARLNHPRVVSVFQFGQNEESTLYYMAMSFIEGRDLREILKANIRAQKHLSNAQVLQIIRDVAEALDYAHKQGVIHRDVKPSNIMVTSDGHGVLTDFGLALNAQEGTIGNTFGSVHYIAPEQAVSSAQAVPQSDLYSLGVVLFEMLTGRVPFEDVSAMSVALKHISDPPPRPSTINAHISSQVEEVIIKALDKDPKKRFPSGTAFIHALEGAFAVSDDEDTHDLDSSQADDASTNVIGAVNTTRANDDTAGSINRTTIEDDIPTINDTAGSRPSAQQIADALDDNRATKQSTDTSKIDVAAILDAEDRKQRRGLFAVGGAIATVLILLALLFAGGVFSTDDGDSGDEPPNTQVAAINGGEDDDETEEPSDSAAIGSEVTEEATEDPEPTPLSEETEESAEATDDRGASTAEVTDEPQPTETPAPTNTIEPTATDEPTATSEPTATETSQPTETPEPTATQQPSATPIPPDVLLSYDGRTLVLQNVASTFIDVSDLRFVPINEDGSQGRSFAANEWDVSDVNRLRSEDCLMVWTLTFAELPVPDFCEFRQGMFSTSRSFWIETRTRESFEVRMGSAVLATCPVVARDDNASIDDPFSQTCEISLDLSN